MTGPCASSSSQDPDFLHLLAKTHLAAPASSPPWESLNRREMQEIPTESSNHKQSWKQFFSGFLPKNPGRDYPWWNSVNEQKTHYIPRQRIRPKLLHPCFTETRAQSKEKSRVGWKRNFSFEIKALGQCLSLSRCGKGNNPHRQVRPKGCGESFRAIPKFSLRSFLWKAFSSGHKWPAGHTALHTVCHLQHWNSAL